MRGNLKSKCACSAGGIGICLCVIFMSLAVVGTAAVGISKNTEDIGKDTSDNSMSSMSSMQSSSDSSKSNASSSSQNSNVIIDFFSGVWGQVILLASFGAMFAGIWFSRDICSRKVLLPISVVGVAIVYISMYNYYSIALEIIGAIILAFVCINLQSSSGKDCKSNMNRRMKQNQPLISPSSVCHCRADQTKVTLDTFSTRSTFSTTVTSYTPS